MKILKFTFKNEARWMLIFLLGLILIGLALLGAVLLARPFR